MSEVLGYLVLAVTTVLAVIYDCDGIREGRARW